MKVKTSITLSEEVMAAVDRLADELSRSEFIEKAIRAFLQQRERDRRNRRELELINRHALELNREAADVLDYQTEL